MTPEEIRQLDEVELIRKLQSLDNDPYFELEVVLWRLVEAHKIDLSYIESEKHWSAGIKLFVKKILPNGYECESTVYIRYLGTTAKIAAMRCYLGKVYANEIT